MGFTYNVKLDILKKYCFGFIFLFSFVLSCLFFGQILDVLEGGLLWLFSFTPIGLIYGVLVQNSEVFQNIIYVNSISMDYYVFRSEMLIFIIFSFLNRSKSPDELIISCKIIMKYQPIVYSIKAKYK